MSLDVLPPGDSSDCSLLSDRRGASRGKRFGDVILKPPMWCAFTAMQRQEAVRMQRNDEWNEMAYGYLAYLHIQGRGGAIQSNNRRTKTMLYAAVMLLLPLNLISPFLLIITYTRICPRRLRTSSLLKQPWRCMHPLGSVYRMVFFLWCQTFGSPSRCSNENRSSPRSPFWAALVEVIIMEIHSNVVFVWVSYRDSSRGFLILQLNGDDS